MRLHRFIGKFDIYQPVIEVSDSDLINQIFRVFRLKMGDSVILCDGQGSEVEAVIDAKDRVATFRVINRRSEEKPKAEKVLLCSILKKENFEVVCQKATEIGIDTIIPIISERTIKTDIRMDRLVKIIKEATEQSERLFMPRLMEPIDFEKAIDMNFDQKVFLSLEGGNLNKQNEALSSAVMVGPEGGWSLNEINLAKEKNWEIITLGKNVLRAETAAILGSYLIA